MDVDDADETESPNRSPRALRTAALIAVAVAAVGMASFLYLHPTFKFGESTAPSVQIRPNPVEGRLVTMTFNSPTTGWVAVDDQAGKLSVFVTHDAGQHWAAQLTVSVAREPWTAEFQFFSASGGIFSVQDYPFLYRTTDAGRHWDQVRVTELAVHSASFVDADHGWLVAFAQAATNQRILYRTSDGGKDWINLGIPVAPGDTMDGVHFSTPTEGWLDSTSRGPYLYATVDGGDTWQQLPILAPAGGWSGGSYSVKAQMLPPSGVAAIVTGTRPQGQCPGFDRQCRQAPFQSDPFSGGPPDIPDLSSAQLATAFEVLTPQSPSRFPGNGLVGPRPLLIGAEQSVMSVDGGRSWLAQNPVFGVAGQADALDWWWTFSGLLFKSTDGGGTWKRVVSTELLVTFTAVGMQVIDNHNAWIGGNLDGDALLLTRDGGTTWTRVALPRA